MGRKGFALIFDFNSRSTIIAIDQDDAEKIQHIRNTIVGLEFEKLKAPPLSTKSKIKLFYVFRRPESINYEIFNDLFNIHTSNCLFGIYFMPQTSEAVAKSKRYIEGMLSKIAVRENSSKSSFYGGNRTSLQHELFNESEEKLMLNDILNSTNESLVSNGIAYKVALFVIGDNDLIEDYIKSKFVVLDEENLELSSLEELEHSMADFNTIPVGLNFVKSMLNFCGAPALSYIVTTMPAVSKGDITIGTYMKDGALETNADVSIDKTILNLGCIISGMPGSGKTRSAMSILDNIICSKNGDKTKTKVAVIASTDEWDSFASSHNINLIRLCDDRTPINLFRCPDGTDVVRFYEDLAMVLADASDAGPYRNPLEKCLLNSFRRVYSDANTPDPIKVFDEINEAIIRLHAKRTNVGIKYTKHGENIKSSLEGLIGILSRPEYSERNGIILEELLRDGIVFNTSRASIQAKKYFYAILLNQIYSTTTSLNSNGDNELRLLICVEEAQLIFGDKSTATVNDIMYRLQDFRKKGIGLILLAHNITDVFEGIRRLCQIKLYMKQAPDIAPIAAKDLIFTYSTSDEVIAKLKHLDSRVAALNYLIKNDDYNAVQDTIFIRTKSYVDDANNWNKEAIKAYLTRKRIKLPSYIISKIAIKKVDPPQSKITKLRISYLGEDVGEYYMNQSDNTTTVEQKLIEGREYSLSLLNERNRIVKSLKFIAKRAIELSLYNEEVIVN